MDDKQKDDKQKDDKQKELLVLLAQKMLDKLDSVDPKALGFVLAGGGCGAAAGVVGSVYLVKLFKDCHSGLALAACFVTVTPIVGCAAVGIAAGLYLTSVYIETENRKEIEQLLINFDSFIALLKQFGLENDANFLEESKELYKLQAISADEFLHRVKKVLKKHGEDNLS